MEDDRGVLVMNMNENMTDPNGLRSYPTDVRHRARWNAWLAGCLVVGLFALAVVVSTGSVGEAAGEGQAVPTSTTLSDADLHRATDVLMQQLANGQSPYADEHPYAGDSVTGWVPVAPNNETLAPEYDRQNSRIPVYSWGESQLLGYDYTFIGFVPKDLANSGTFDAAGVRAERFGGCDPLANPDKPDQVCLERKFGQVGEH